MSIASEPLPGLSAEESVLLAAAFARQLASSTLGKARWAPEPHQIPPPGDWYGWLLLAGRFAGKTDACANYVVEHVRGPACMSGPAPHWIGIIAPTLGDAATACWAGPSGIRAHDPSAVLRNGIGGASIVWPNGSEAKLFGTHTEEDVERLRAGGNRCLIWAEEIAAWRWLDEAWAQMRFGLRIGPRARWVGSTTPKPRALIKKFDKGEFRNVVVTHATSHDNPHLKPEILEALLDSYGGTALAMQEILGRIVEQDENALWQRDRIEMHRLDPVAWPAQRMQRITVGVDPSGGAGEQGIVVNGKTSVVISESTAAELPGLMPPVTAEMYGKRIEVGFTLADVTAVGALSPEQWGSRAVRAALDWEADDICVEINFGGDMAVSTVVGAADAAGAMVPVRVVRASRGKRVRAEPVAALATRGRLRHVGQFEALEDQLCTWTPEADYSPDRLDADVWGVTHLGLVKSSFTGRGGMPAASALAGRSLLGARTL